MLKSSTRRISLILFLFTFGVLTALINGIDIGAYHFLRDGIRAIVETGHIYTDDISKVIVVGSTDNFLHEGHVYLNKQPGQAFICSIVYFFLHKLGVTYASSFLLTGCLITMFTSSIMTATMAVLVFNIAYKITERQKMYRRCHGEVVLNMEKQVCQM